jgi:hypothetical protein
VARFHGSDRVLITGLRGGGLGAEPSGSSRARCRGPARPNGGPRTCTPPPAAQAVLPPMASSVSYSWSPRRSGFSGQRAGCGVVRVRRRRPERSSRRERQQSLRGLIDVERQVGDRDPPQSCRAVPLCAPFSSCCLQTWIVGTRRGSIRVTPSYAIIAASADATGAPSPTSRSGRSPLGPEIKPRFPTCRASTGSSSWVDDGRRSHRRAAATATRAAAGSAAPS